MATTEMGANAKATIESLAPELGIDLAPVEILSSSLDATDYFTRPAEDQLIDLIVLCDDLAGMSGMQLAREIRAVDRNVRIVLAADTGDDAYEALQLGVNSYLIKSVACEGMCEVVVDAVIRELTAVKEQRDQTIVLRFRDRPRRVNKGDIEYIETADHDQMVHFKNGEKYAIRSSSQALFDQLSHDGRFFKAGSSFIVNLTQVRSFEPDGFARMMSGAAVAIPVRLRKSFENALLDFGM